MRNTAEQIRPARAERITFLLQTIALTITALFMASILIGLAGCSSMKAKSAYTKGTKLMGEKKYVEAVKEFYAGVRANPKDINGYMALTDALMAAKRDPSLHTGLVAVINEGATPETGKKLEEIIDDEIYNILINTKKIAPDSELPNLGLGKFYLGKGQIEKAKTELQMAAKKNPANPVANYLLGVISVGERKYDQAIGTFKKLIVLDPAKSKENAEVIDLAYPALVELIGVQGKTDAESVKIVEDSLKKSPEFSRGYTVLGLIAYKNGNTDEAEKHFTTALQKSPQEEAYVHKLLGAILEAKGENEKAVKEYKEFLKVFSRDGQDELLATDEARVKVFTSIDPDYKNLKAVREKVKAME